MAARLRWRQPLLRQLGVDQTRLVIGGQTDGSSWSAFHFLVVVDSGKGRHRRHSPPRHVAERPLPHRRGVAFLLHTGDVVNLVGSADQYTLLVGMIHIRLVSKLP